MGKACGRAIAKLNIFMLHMALVMSRDRKEISVDDRVLMRLWAVAFPISVMKMQSRQNQRNGKQGR